MPDESKMKTKPLKLLPPAARQLDEHSLKALSCAHTLSDLLANGPVRLYEPYIEGNLSAAVGKFNRKVGL
jgi:hypothetical protein